MKSKTIRNIFVASTLVAAMGTAQAELSALQTQILADHQKMQSLNADERRAFRKEIFGNGNKNAQRTYNQTYKAMHEAGLIVEKAPIGGASSKAMVANRAVGTNIQYDSGTVETTNQGLPSQSVGNKFNTGWNPDAGASGALNPVLSAGSVTQITVSMAAAGGSAAFMTIANGTGSGASVVDSPSLSANVGMNTISVGPYNTTGPFLGSVWQNGGGTTTATAADIVAVATGTTNGQGYHGVSFNDIAMTAFADIPNKNAVFRVSGQLLQDSVPVELMNFSVE